MSRISKRNLYLYLLHEVLDLNSLIEDIEDTIKMEGDPTGSMARQVEYYTAEMTTLVSLQEEILTGVLDSKVVAPRAFRRPVPMLRVIQGGRNSTVI